MRDRNSSELPDLTAESFGQILSQFESNRTPKASESNRDGTVVSVSNDSVLLDIGLKTEGSLPASELGKHAVKPGDRLQVTIQGRDPEGYYQLTLCRAARPSDWQALERAYQEKANIVGRVTGMVKGGFSVDVGVRAFLPASRSGARDPAEMEKLVDREIECRIVKLDLTEEDIVVDRRVIVDEEVEAMRQRRYSELKEGDVVRGTVRSLTEYGAFVDIGGLDALLHVGDISWSRVEKPADALSIGHEIRARILKVDSANGRVAIGIKQLQLNPWDSVTEKYPVGSTVRGRVTRLTDFGAFLELEPGVEGLIHISEMSWTKRLRKASDILTVGETAVAVVLGLNGDARRISLGLKQALGDPWIEATKKFPLGSVVTGRVVSLTNFGAFLEVAEGIEGMIHVSDINAERRLHHPREMLKLNQVVNARVLECDVEKRRLKLGIKQLSPTSRDEYLREHRAGEVVTGRVLELLSGAA
ncbi:MAG: S1 RNA-binding domain-containing protein, partial [Acidobacteria bacterium]|nr:S1 RNA-binding domain-containing protein [Acidobacteriota bacterium]